MVFICWALTNQPLQLISNFLITFSVRMLLVCIADQFVSNSMVHKILWNCKRVFIIFNLANVRGLKCDHLRVWDFLGSIVVKAFMNCFKCEFICGCLLQRELFKDAIVKSINSLFLEQLSLQPVALSHCLLKLLPQCVQYCWNLGLCWVLKGLTLICQEYHLLFAIWNRAFHVT